jgi:hypothetical protein
MKETLDTIIFRKTTSVVNRIKNSVLLSDKFNSFCRQMEDSPIESVRIKNLRFAKHRFDSIQTPLGRSVLMLDALIMTAMWASVNRQGQNVASDMDDFLEFITEERVLTLALCADAGDEVIRIIRYIDTEGHDIAEVPHEINACLSRLDALFVKRKALESGYTKFAIDSLQAKRRTYFIRREPFSLGGPGKLTEAILDRCFQRLQNYCVLAESVIRAEFPSFELLSAFSVFDLSSRESARQAKDPLCAQMREDSLKRLAQVFSVDLPRLQEQLLDHSYFAQAYFKQGALSSVPAKRRIVF